MQVAKEIVSGQRDEGLWAKAFALQDGDEKKTKAHYIRLRVEQLGRTTRQPKLGTENTNKPTKGQGVFENSTIIWGMGLLIIVLGGIIIQSSSQTVTTEPMPPPESSQSKSDVFERSLLGEWNCHNPKILFRKVYYDDNQYRQTSFVKQDNDWPAGGSWKLVEGGLLVEEDSIGKFTYEIWWSKNGKELHLTNILDKNFKIICTKDH